MHAQPLLGQRAADREEHLPDRPGPGPAAGGPLRHRGPRAGERPLPLRRGETPLHLFSESRVHKSVAEADPISKVKGRPIGLFRLEFKSFNFHEIFAPTASCESRSVLRCSVVGESNCCSSGDSYSDVEGKDTELSEPRV